MPIENKYGDNFIANSSADSGLDSWTVVGTVTIGVIGSLGTTCFELAASASIKQTFESLLAVPGSFQVQIDTLASATDGMLKITFTRVDTTKDVVVVPLSQVGTEVVVVLGNSWLRTSTTILVDDPNTVDSITFEILATGSLSVDNIQFLPALDIPGIINMTPRTIHGDVVMEGTLDVDRLIAGQLIVGTNVTMGAGATITWDPTGASGVIPPTAGEVGARPDSWTPTAGDVGALATTWVGTTFINEYGLYTGTINANKINVGTLTGFTLTGATINVLDWLTVQASISSTVHGVKFGDTYYSVKPVLLSCYQNSAGTYSELSINGQNSNAYVEIINCTLFTSECPVQINSNLTVTGSITGTVSNATSAGSASHLSGTYPNIGGTGCYADVSGGTFRLKNSSGSYLSITGSSLYFYRADGSYVQLV
jgi:hypothetical protein